MSAKVSVFSGVLWTDRSVFYPEPQQLAELYPAATPFLTAAMAQVPEGGPTLPNADFKFFEHRAGWRYESFTLNDATPPSWNTAGAPGDTLDAVVTIDNVVGVTIDDALIGSQVEIWDSTETTYKGVALVLTAPSSTTITLKSIGNAGVATEAIPALADNDVFYVTTSSHGEETTAPEATSDELEVVYNSAMLMRTTVEIGETLKNAALRGETDELARLRKLRGNKHKMKMAKGLYFSYRPGGIGGTAHGAGGGTDSTFTNHVTDSNSKTVRTTMGIFPAMRRYGRTSGSQQNNFTYAKASFNYNRWVEMSEKIHQYSTGEGMKVAYAGPGAISFFAKIGAEGFVTSQGLHEPLKMSEMRQSALGLNYRIIDTPHGPVRLVPDPLLRGTPYANHVLFVDPANIRLVRYERDRYFTNIKTDDNPRVQKDEFMSYFGIKLTLMETHSLLQLT